jgi:dephospho-CoA kinase
VVIVGITGGIGSGKSTVSQMLSAKGAAVIDADKLGHELFRPNTDAWHEVVAAFGRGILDHDDEIDRASLADLVFSDPAALDRLNNIMHPRIRRVVEGKIEDFRTQGFKVVVVEAALLIEAGWIDLVDQVWVVAAPEAEAVHRLCSQKGFTEAQAVARIRSQMSPAERAKHAHRVVENDSSLDALDERVERLWRGLLPLKQD